MHNPNLWTIVFSVVYSKNGKSSRPPTFLQTAVNGTKNEVEFWTLCCNFNKLSTSCSVPELGSVLSSLPQKTISPYLVYQFSIPCLNIHWWSHVIAILRSVGCAYAWIRPVGTLIPILFLGRVLGYGWVKSKDMKPWRRFNIRLPLNQVTCGGLEEKGWRIVAHNLKANMWGIKQGNSERHPASRLHPMLLVIFLLLSFGNNGNQAVPIHIFEGSASSTSTIDGPSQRSLFTIIWGCFSTVFVCAWVSVHPNIPSAEECGWKSLWRRFRLMFWMLIAPELILVWAVRQWSAAKKIADIYNEARCQGLVIDAFLADNFWRLL